MTEVPAFLRSGGELGKVIAAHDWLASTLGAPADWPAHLQAAIAIKLCSPLPMALLWGPDGLLLYNAFYSEIAGTSHPAILGQPVRDVWPEVAAFNDQVLLTVLTGETLTYSRKEMTLLRGGSAEQVFFDLNYSPCPMRTVCQPA